MAQNCLSWGDKLPFGCVLAPIRFGACILWQLVPTGVFTRQSVALGVYCPDPKYKRTADSLVKICIICSLCWQYSVYPAAKRGHGHAFK